MLLYSLKLASVALLGISYGVQARPPPVSRSHPPTGSAKVATNIASRDHQRGIGTGPSLVSSNPRSTARESPARNTTNSSESTLEPVVDTTSQLEFPSTFNNPIKPGGAADPWVIYHKESDTYYLIQSQQGGLVVLASQDLTSFPEEGPLVWTPPAGLKELWAPELHWIDDAWFIYVAMDDGDNANHRMYVLKGTSADPTQPFDLVGKMTTPDDNWAIDGTIFRYTNGKLYFVWSGWTDRDHKITQNLYIAELCSPTQVCSDRVLLHEPNFDWQKSGADGVNEGPTMLEHGGRWFLVYSAAGSWTDDYCLAFMGIDNGADPMNAANWWRLDDRPVMWSNPEAGVWAPGHASFTTDRDGTPYVVYHAIDRPGAGWAGRTARTEAFGWNPDGSPAFPRPAGFNVSLPHPQ